MGQGCLKISSEGVCNGVIDNRTLTNFHFGCVLELLCWFEAKSKIYMKLDTAVKHVEYVEKCFSLHILWLLFCSSIKQCSLLRKCSLESENDFMLD